MATAVSAKRFLKDVYQESADDDIFNGAAVLGFYLTLAIFPAVIFVLAVVPYLPIPNVGQAIMDLLHQALPVSAADMFTGVVRHVTSERRGGLLSFGLLAALWATSTGMHAIMKQLNITYDVDEERGFLRSRLVAAGLSLMFMVLVIGGFSLIVLGGQIQDWLGTRFGSSDALLGFFVLLRWAIILAGLQLAFALIYHLAPNVDQKFSFVTAGSVVGVVLLLFASLAFSWYTKSFGRYDATYGSVGAAIVLMLWLYMAGLTILFGSEINAVMERRAVRGAGVGGKASSPETSADERPPRDASAPTPLVAEPQTSPYGMVAAAVIVLSIVALLRPRT